MASKGRSSADEGDRKPPYEAPTVTALDALDACRRLAAAGVPIPPSALKRLGRSLEAYVDDVGEGEDDGE